MIATLQGITPVQFVQGLSPAAWFRWGVGITSSLGAISQWDDQSGNGRHLKQATGTNQPALEADSSITFDGVDNYLKCDAFTLNQPETVYILGRQVTWTSGDVVFDGDATLSARFTQVTASPQVAINAGGGNAAANSDWVVNTYAAVAVVINGVSSMIQVNNNAATTGGAGAANMGGFTLGARGAGDANYGNIQVKEVIVYAAAHDAATRTRVIGYLMSVGGI